MPSEKNTRALLRSAVERAIGRSRAVVFDSLNNIKGYRYELWCIARQAGTRYCMVHVDTPAETCRGWNAGRGGDAYAAEVFDDLASRFERPEARNRWDAPLFTVSPALGEAHIREQAAAVAAAATESAATAAAAAVAAGAAVVATTGRALQPTCSTTTTGPTATNLLHEIDKAAQSVLDRVSEAQAAAGGGAPGAVSFDDGIPPLYLGQPIPLPELRRHKRMFMRLATNNTFNRVSDAGAARRMFVDYLRDQVAATQ